LITYAAASARPDHADFMHPLRKATIARAMALALLSVAMWQYQASQSSAAAQPVWAAPLAAPLQLIHPFYQPNSDYSAGHRGVDYRVKPNQVVFAPTDAVVWFTGKVVDRNVLSLRTASGDLLSFEPVCSDLTVGQTVARGQMVGRVCLADPGYKQHCHGQLCLHFSLRTNNGYLSPLVRWGALSPTVLLPVSKAD
jgi:murein DD-endopeptidase MepM/ murein hydrolase activator NlpD